MALPWIDISNDFLGYDENSNSRQIKGWVDEMGPNWFKQTFDPSHDHTPWNGVFVNYCLKKAGVEDLPINYMQSSAWLSWGSRLIYPVPGCIVVFSGNTNNHIGFVMGYTPDKRLVVRGGNQDNKVGDYMFSRGIVASYRWPTNVGFPNAVETTMKKVNFIGSFCSSLV
jgi:uncharacterized protein (TIGR02594 family)